MFLGHIPIVFSGFNKLPIEGDQLPVETKITVSITTNTRPIRTSHYITFPLRSVNIIKINAMNKTLTVLMIYYFCSEDPKQARCESGCVRPGEE